MATLSLRPATCCRRSNATPTRRVAATALAPPKGHGAAPALTAAALAAGAALAPAAHAAQVTHVVQKVCDDGALADTWRSAPAVWGLARCAAAAEGVAGRHVPSHPQTTLVCAHCAPRSGGLGAPLRPRPGYFSVIEVHRAPPARRGAARACRSAAAAAAVCRGCALASRLRGRLADARRARSPGRHAVRAGGAVQCVGGCHLGGQRHQERAAVLGQVDQHPGGRQGAAVRPHRCRSARRRCSGQHDARRRQEGGGSRQDGDRRRQETAARVGGQGARSASTLCAHTTRHPRLKMLACAFVACVADPPDPVASVPPDSNPVCNRCSRCR